jgi:hypothetical protein
MGGMGKGKKFVWINVWDLTLQWLDIVTYRSVWLEGGRLRLIWLKVSVLSRLILMYAAKPSNQKHISILNYRI